MPKRKKQTFAFLVIAVLSFLALTQVAMVALGRGPFLFGGLGSVAVTSEGIFVDGFNDSYKTPYGETCAIVAYISSASYESCARVLSYSVMLKTSYPMILLVTPELSAVKARLESSNPRLRVKIIQRIIELPRINFAVLLHVDDTAPFKGGESTSPLAHLYLREIVAPRTAPLWSPSRPLNRYRPVSSEPSRATRKVSLVG